MKFMKNKFDLFYDFVKKLKLNIYLILAFNKAYQVSTNTTISLHYLF